MSDRLNADSVRVLFVAANPGSTARLRVGAELRAVRERLRGIKLDASIDLISTEAARPVDLTLNLGEGDAVHPGDLFEVLGAPIADTDNRAIVGFERLGQCAVQPFEGSVSTSACRLDLGAWPRLDRQAWTRGGFVHLVQQAPRFRP